MSLHVMIDNETMGLGPTAAVIQIAAVPFQFVGECNLSCFDQTISLESALGIGCTTDQSTIDWWKKQSPKAQKSVTENAQDISVVMVNFIAWFNRLGKVDGVWSHGASFDIPQLEFIFRTLGLKCPWKYTSVRDTRTLHWLAGLPRPKRKTAHIAFFDCKDQIDDVLESLRLLRK